MGKCRHCLTNHKHGQSGQIKNPLLRGVRWMSGLERWLDWRPGGPGLVRTPLRQLRFGTLAIPFTPLCQCLSEEIIKAAGPFYLVSISTGVYARGSKRSHQFALEMSNLSWTPPPTLPLPPLANCTVYRHVIGGKKNK